MKDEMMKAALQLCIDEMSGQYDDLVYRIGDEFTEEFVRTGVIRIGFAGKQKIWRVTSLADKFKETVG